MKLIFSDYEDFSTSLPATRVEEAPSASKLATFLHSENSDDFCNRLQIKLQEKQNGNDSSRFDGNFDAKTYKSLDTNALT